MKKIRSIWIIAFFVLGLLSILTNSCKKDDPVIKVDVVITWANPSDITAGTPLSTLQLNATAGVEGTFVYTPSLGTILNVGTNQNLEVQFIPKDTTKYNSATKTVTINVREVITVTDIDGNIYHGVLIGTQVWMVENMMTTKYRDGTSIPNVTDHIEWMYLNTGAYCDYDNTSSNSLNYGRLYNWYAAADARNIAPIGWHVPTDEDWSILITYLGGINSAGGKLKEIETTHWAPPNKGASNASGFTALPSGYRVYYGSYIDKGEFGILWSANEHNNSYASCLVLSNENGFAVYNSSGKVLGYSIRCVMDY